MKQSKKILTLAVGCITGLLAVPSIAQESRLQVEEIIVTATKRAVSLQDVPIAITAVTSSDIAGAGLESIQDAASMVPNFEFPTSRNPGESDVAIRGISANIPFSSAGFDAGFGVYLDGVYQGRQDAANADLGEVERIEVLRGPQGTLFGKNTIAGAINIVTKKPGNEFEGKFEADIGDYEYRRARGLINIPLIEDKLAARFSATRASRGGYVTNVTTNDDDVGSYDQWGARANFAYTPTETSRFYLSFDASDYDEKTYVVENIENGGAEGEVSFDNEKYTTHTDMQDLAGTSGFGTSLTYEHDFSNGYSLTSITGYRANEASVFWDVDLRPMEGYYSDLVFDQSQFTQEIRIASPSDGQFDYVAGLYYYEHENDFLNASCIGIDWFAYAGCFNYNHELKTSSYAAFVHANYRINDQLSMFGGMRYTDESKSFSKSTTDIDPPGYVSGILGGLEGQYPDIRDIDNDNVSTTLGLQFSASDNAMYYASFATGFKSGGYNSAATSLFELESNLTVDPEKATSYEVGIKSSWMDNRLTANAALFVIDYEDLQVQVWDPSIGLGGVSVWGNAAKVGSQGLELETVFQATENLQLAAAVGYVDATYDVFPGVALPEGEGAPGDDNDGLIDAKTDASGNQVPIAPKWNANVTASHQYPLKNGGSLVTRIEYTYKGDRFSDQGSANTPGDELPSYSLVNLRLGYNPEAANWSVNLWARNLTNTQKAEESRYFNFVGARQTKRYMTPRTYGVSFNYDF